MTTATQTNNPLMDGKGIRLARNVRGWTLQRLSDESHVPMWRLWKLEQNLLIPDADDLQKIWSAMSQEKS